MTRQILVHNECFLEIFEPIGLAEFGGGISIPPSARYGVVVIAQTVHHSPGFPHQNLCPIVVVVYGAASDPVNPVPGKIADIGLETAVEVRVELGPHVPPAAPVFVSDTEISQLPWFFPPIFPTQIGHRAFPVERDILDPLLHLPDRPAPHIPAYVGFTSQLLAKVQKFVGAEMIIFCHFSPVGVDHGRPFVLGADTVFPMILVGKTSPRPPQHRDLDLSEGLHHIVPDAPGIGYGAVLTDPISAIDASPKMLGKMAVDVFVYRFLAQVHIDDQGVRGHFFPFVLC